MTHKNMYHTSWRGADDWCTAQATPRRETYRDKQGEKYCYILQYPGRRVVGMRASRCTAGCFYLCIYAESLHPTPSPCRTSHAGTRAPECLVYNMLPGMTYEYDATRTIQIPGSRWSYVHDSEVRRTGEQRMALIIIRLLIDVETINRPKTAVEPQTP